LAVSTKQPTNAKSSQPAEPVFQQISQPTVQPTAQPILQTVVNQAKTLAWLTGRVEALEADLALAQETKGKIIPPLENSQVNLHLQQKIERLQKEIERLQKENDRLSTELHQTQARLEGIQQFLSGDKAETPESRSRELNSTDPPSPNLVKLASTTPQNPTPTTSQPQPSLGKLDSDALKALDAIFHYNDSVATSNQERWAISIPIMKDLLKQVGKATQPKIDAVLKAKSETIDAHHRMHGLGERHNRVHKGNSISNFISL
jgi:chaperonin cofactor prefoldin